MTVNNWIDNYTIGNKEERQEGYYCIKCSRFIKTEEEKENVQETERCPFF